MTDNVTSFGGNDNRGSRSNDWTLRETLLDIISKIDSGHYKGDLSGIVVIHETDTEGWEVKCRYAGNANAVEFQGMLGYAATNHALTTGE